MNSLNKSFLNKVMLQVRKEKDTSAAYPIICPYCFRSFYPSKAVFRAMHSVGSDPDYRLQEDEKLNLYRSKLKLRPLSETEAVIDPENIYPENVKSIKGVILEVIDRYGVPTRKRLCPYCHNELPSTAGIGPTNIISVVGSPKVGKSTYMAVLLHTLQSTTAANFDAKCYFSNSRYRNILTEHENSLFVKGNKLNSDISEDYLDHLTLVVKFKKNEIPLSFIFYDVSSEAMLNQKYLETYEANIKNSSGIIFLVEPNQLEERRRAPEVGGSKERFYRPRDVITHLYNNFIFKKYGGKSPIPTAVVLTKADKLKLEEPDSNTGLLENYNHKGCFNLKKFGQINHEIRNFIKENDHVFMENVNRFFNDFACFGVSAIRELKNLDSDKVAVQPCRIDEPLLWIMYKLGYIEGGEG